MTAKAIRFLSIQHLVWYFVFFVVAMTYVRIFFGVEITDEAYYVACAYLTSIGGKPYTNDLYFQQNASVIYEPLIYVYNLIFGSAGIMLFVRHLYFLLAAGCAWSFYSLFKKIVNSELAALIAILPISFIPYSLPTLGYNTISSLCLGTGMALSLNAFLYNRTKLFYAGALFFSLAIFAYPSFSIGIFIFYAFLLGLNWNRSFKLVQNLFVKKIIYPMVFCGALVILYWAITILRFGLENLKLSLEITVAYGALGSPLKKISLAMDLLEQAAPSLQLLTVVISVGMVLKIFFSLSWLWTILCISIIYFLNPSTEVYLSHTFLSFITLCSLPSFLIYKNKKSDEFKIAMTIFVPSFIMALVIGWTSSMTIYATALISQFAFLSILFLNSAKANKYLVLFSVLLIHIIMNFWNYTTVYREDNISDLTTMMSSGPYAGLMTTPERKQLMQEIQTDLDNAKGNAKSIVFYDSFPAGYLFSNLYPMTPSVFIHPLPYGKVMRDFYTEYYQDTRRYPDIVFQFESFPFLRNSIDYFRKDFTKPPYDTFYDLLPKSGQYNLLLSRTHYKIWKRKNL